MVFYDLGGLSKSNEVKINGYVIGKVYELNAQDKNVNGIVATINLTEDVNIPENSTAVISSPIIGSSYIDIEKGNSSVFLEPGDTLRTRLDVGILDDVKSQLTPTLTSVREGIDSIKMLLSNVNKLFTYEARADLHQTLQNLSVASRSLTRLVDAENGALALSLGNVNAFTANLRNNNDSINMMISNANRATAKLADLEIQPVIDTLSRTISQLKAVVAKMDSKDGTLGALINDKAVYNKLYDAILSAEILMDDLRANPKRYVNLSIFGRKDKDGPLTSPSKKDTISD
jgi:phospholipid/cholesterol/gamma-HCH transport system substrate-binding protein